MNSRLPIKTKFGAHLISNPGMKSVIPIGTWWEFEHYRNGKLIDQWEQKNVTTDEGLNAMLDIMFHGSTQITTWYIGLFEDNYTPLVTNTYASPGFTESTAYDEANRVAYNEAAASSKVTTNSANKATFTINATKTIYGAFLVGGGTGANTKSDTAGGGVLFASSQFAASKSVVDNDVLMVSCSITLADS